VNWSNNLAFGELQLWITSIKIRIWALNSVLLIRMAKERRSCGGGACMLSSYYPTTWWKTQNDMEIRKENQERVRYFKSNGSERSASPCHNELLSSDSFVCLCCQRREETKNLEKKGVSVPGQIHERNLQFDTHTPFSVLKAYYC
jgi:hypothetical protein